MRFIAYSECIRHLYWSYGSYRSSCNIVLLASSAILWSNSSIPQWTRWHLRIVLLLIREPLFDPTFISELRFGSLARWQHQDTIWVLCRLCFWFSIWDEFIDIIIHFDICLLDLLLRFWGVEMLGYLFIWSLEMDKILLRLLRILMLLWL